MRPTAIELRDVSIGYGGFAILEAVSMKIEQGEFCALLGPNGAGKTTLLRGILGLVPVMSGRIEYHFDRAAVPLGYVPQRDALDPIFPLTALEVVTMGTYAGLPPLWPIGARRRHLATECLEKVGLGARAHQPFWALSGGQKQRVLIARALAVEPGILVLDEPTAGVDHAASASITSLISRLNREKSLTVILVSHHAELILPVADSFVWVDEGKAEKGAADLARLHPDMAPLARTG